jgi:hypothetical protein
MYLIKYIFVFIICINSLTLFAQNADSVSRPVYGSLFETWDSAFSYNNWTIECENWQIDSTEGNPAPCATFSSDTNITNYSCALISDEIIFGYGGPIGRKQRFQFDYKIIDNSSSGTEMLILKFHDGNETLFSDTLRNYNSTEWIHYNTFIDLSSGITRSY